MFKKFVLMCILAVVMCPVANATQIVSSDFSIGIGYTHFRGWDTFETDAVNTPSTQGEFTFSPSVSGIEGTGGGWLFPNRVPTATAMNGGFGYDDPANPWGMTLNASYNGVAQSGGTLTVTITSMSIYGSDWGTGAATMWFDETTAGNVSSSAAATIPVYTVHTDPSCCVKLIWNPGALQVDGETATRSFGIDYANTAYNLLFVDGFEIFGNVTYEYIPEPATMILLSLGGLFIRKR